MFLITLSSIVKRVDVLVRSSKALERNLTGIEFSTLCSSANPIKVEKKY
jgi:hypothetical protein